MGNLCCICKKTIDSDTAPILAMSGFGSPKCMCEDCEADVNSATLGREAESVYAAMDRIGNKLSENAIEDSLVLETVKEIMEAAKDRVEKIKLGEYDFSAEDSEDESEEDGVPDELLETEEDKKLFEQEEEKNKKLDKITNWICLAIIILALGYMIYHFFIAS